MRKNRLVRNIALLSIIIAMLPAAYAQSGTGSWFFVAVNALIVGVALFILQAFLIPKKEPKEQTVAWVAIIAASLVVAFFFGRDAFLWQGPLGKFLNIYVIVNTLIIAIVGYFALGLLKIGKDIKSPEGNVGYGLLIFIGALVWAIGIQNSYGPIFIWQAYQYFISYFIGPEGILNPYPPQYRLLVFAGSAVLLAFFFSQYLITGTGANNKVNYGLALILAMNMASSGVSVRSVIILGEIVFTLVLQKALAAGPASNKWASWLLATGLVGWASAAMTFGTEYQGALATPIGWIMSWFGLVDGGTVAQPTSIGWWGKILLVVLGLMLLFGAGLFLIGKGEFKRRLMLLGVGGLKKRLNAILGFTNFLRDNDPEREPQVFIENRHLFHALVNYTIRSEINYRYWGFVKEGIEMGHKLDTEIGPFRDIDALTKEIIEYRSGHNTIKGWNNLNREVVDLTNAMFLAMFRIYIGAQHGLKRRGGSYAREASAFTDIQTRANELNRRISAAKKLYDDRVKAYGAHFVLKAYNDITLSMANPTGDYYEHPQLFAKPGAEYNDGSRAGGTREEPSDEINQYGQIVADFVRQKNTFGDYNPATFQAPRKLRNPSEILRPMNYIEHMENISRDWKGSSQDIRYGIWSPRSRTVSTYLDALKNHVYPEWADMDIPFTTPATTSNPALDMRALANPGLKRYWGRKHLHDVDPALENPYPTMTSLGLRDYLRNRVQLDMMDKTKAQAFLMKYPADTGLPEKVVVEGEVKSPIGMYLGETPPEQGGGH